MFTESTKEDNDAELERVGILTSIPEKKDTAEFGSTYNFGTEAGKDNDVLG